MSIENFKKQTSGNMIQWTFTFSQDFPFFLKLKFSNWHTLQSSNHTAVYEIATEGPCLMWLSVLGKSHLANAFFGPKYFITATFCTFGYIIKIAVMKYFAPKNALAKYIWKVLKNRNNEIRSNEIRIRRGSPVLANAEFCGFLQLEGVVNIYASCFDVFMGLVVYIDY